MEPNCSQLLLDMIRVNADHTKTKARQKLEEICMRYLPFRYMRLCSVMNPLELYKICEEASS
jgi:hypothetical protein